MAEMKSYSTAIGLLVFACQMALASTASSSMRTRKEQEDYLKQFAYMGSSSRDPRLGELTNPDEVFRMAVRKFQMMAGLNTTGTVDSETQKMMNMPRCGVADEVGMGMITRRRRRRYAAEGSKWGKTTLTYRINSFTPDMPKTKVISEIETALKHWSDVSPLRFSQVTSKYQTVDIDIDFFRRDHGDGASFDGPGKTLAHAFFPRFGGNTHFDEDETWTSRNYSGTNLLQVAIHEFGHAFGLSHSDVKESIMAPFYAGYNPSIGLHSDDIAGITYIYGSRAGLATSTSTTKRPIVPVTRAPTTTRAPPPRALCRDPSMDAFFTTGGELHLFKGSDYYKLDWLGILPGYPKSIKSEWLGLPNDIDTAFYTGGFVFFFKGDQVWYYELRTRSLQTSYPQKISARFAGVPSNLDAAFIWSGNGKLYFIKDDKYYRVSHFLIPTNSRVDPNFPSKLKYWKGLPDKIDAAFNLGNSRTYFFSGKNYYRFNDVKFEVDDGFPAPTGRFWLNCPNVQSVESHPDMMENEWTHGKDQFIPSSGFHLTSLRLPIAFSALSTLSILFSVLKYRLSEF